MAVSYLNQALLKLSKRSEKASFESLVQSFVDIGALFTLLSAPENQILYGRRGTGKTHALVYLASIVDQNDDFQIYLDLSNLGSSGGIYNDQNETVASRATRLLVDTLSNVHEGLFKIFVDDCEKFDLSVSGPLLDKFGESISEVVVTGDIEQETYSSSRHENSCASGIGISVTPTSISGSIDSKNSNSASTQSDRKITQKGTRLHHIHFGSVRSSLQKLIKLLSPHKVWILLDEWSSIPLELQPFLADLFRRSFFPVPGLVAKIAAITYRSQFQIVLDRNEYIGFELGADISVNIDLDDFMVFDNNPDRAREFFRNLLYKHLQSSDEYKSQSIYFESESDMISQIFTQKNAFDELVRAAEGVPRDAIYIASLAAQYALDNTISIPNVRKAAREWYIRGKESTVQSKEQAMRLLNWIVDKVIGERKARAFLLNVDESHDLIQNLFDSRVLHILKKNISSHDEPGVRYNAYKLDYGCYVALMNTSRQTAGLLPGDNDGSYIEVPPDDYRAIRRAILRLNDYIQQIEDQE